MARRPQDEWPDALLLLGDQIYADELTPAPGGASPGAATATPNGPTTRSSASTSTCGVYCDAWSDPEVRWLMSTVPVAMIFDDHDVRDDWNTSAVWRAQMREKPWWRDRVRSALASYWVYQHLGNLSPDEVAADPDTRRSSSTTATPGRCWSTWPTAPTPRPRAVRPCGSASAGTSGTAAC